MLVFVLSFCRGIYYILYCTFWSDFDCLQNDETGNLLPLRHALEQMTSPVHYLENVFHFPYCASLRATFHLPSFISPQLGHTPTVKLPSSLEEGCILLNGASHDHLDCSHVSSAARLFKTLRTKEQNAISRPNTHLFTFGKVNRI